MTSVNQRPLRTTFLLVLLCVPGVLSLLPTLGPTLTNLPAGSPPAAVMLLLSVIQSLVLLTIAALAGAYLAPKLGFGAPGLTGGGLLQSLRRNAPIAVGAGIILGMAAVLIDAAVFRPYLPDSMYMLAQAPKLYDLVPSLLYGGIAEEVLMRWGFMTLITWVLFRLLQGGKGKLQPAILWIGIVGAAVLFGLGHLPVVRSLVPEVTTGILVRTIVQNGLPGVVFGWFYARRGLESAMLAHMGTHIGMFVLRLLLA